MVVKREVKAQENNIKCFYVGEKKRKSIKSCYFINDCYFVV